MHNPARLDRLRHALQGDAKSADAFLVTHPPNVRYLTGFTGDSTYLLVTADRAVLLSDLRYQQQIKEECPDFAVELRGPGTKMLELVSRTLGRSGITKLAIESDSISFGFASRLAQSAENLELIASAGRVEQLRAVKDDEEIATIRRAIEVAQSAFRVVRAALKPSLTEREVAHRLEEQIRWFGGEGCSFPPIVAAGATAALPHYRPAARPISEASALLVDWGSVYDGYASDLTRMIWMGPVDRETEQVYETVAAAQRAAISAVGPGVPRSAVDAAARSIIEAAGYGEAFGHGVGHGIGLEIHEAPRLAAGEDETLQMGMIVTIEPGIYLPGRLGVRLEDDVLVTAEGHENLSCGASGLDDPAWLL